MTLTLAKVAGVKRACSMLSSFKVRRLCNQYNIFFKLAGATEIYKIGGAHAIGVAYGTESIKRSKNVSRWSICYCAKKQVYGDVALDMAAGPEIAILCS